MEKASINIFKKNKVLFVLVFIVLLISIYVVPTLARYKSKIRLDDINVWDGSVAGNYRSGNGTQNNPYVISNGQELAYLLQQSQTNDYENTYFTLNNDIVLNDGLFVVDENKKYVKNNTTYYLNEDKYYTDSEYQVLEGTVNKFASINNFKGTIDGNYHTIYGLFLQDTTKELALFTSLEGTIKNLYIENALVDGGNITSILASKATNSHIENISVDGNVINNSGELLGKVIELSDKTIELSNEEKIESINYTLNDIEGNISNTSLRGTLEVDGTATVSINGNQIADGEFNIALGSDISALTITATSLETVEVSLTNLEYVVDYTENIASSLVGYAKNSELKNIIANAKVHASGLGSGIIGISSSTTLTNAYNTGDITSTDVASGIIGYTIGDSNTINNTYNTGNITGVKKGSIIGVLNASTTVVRNTFNTNNLTPIYQSNNSILSVFSSYSLSTDLSIGNFTNASYSSFISKSFMKNTLHYNEYVSDEDLEEHEGNVWLYTSSKFPILYFDNSQEPKVTIHASNYSWTDLGFGLDKIYLNVNVTFNIESYEELNPVESIYYYISSTELNNTEIQQITDWEEFSSIQTISEEGEHIIYVKAVDYEGNEYYANSDILVVDKTNPTVSINLESSTWNTNNNNLSYLYIDDDNSIAITTSDLVSGIKSIKYVITDRLKTIEEINELELNDYSLPITLSQTGANVIYAIVVDNSNNKTIVNTDYLVLNGYRMTSMYEGLHEKTSKNSLLITDKSKVSFIFEYQDDTGILTNDSHVLTSNTLLPENTKMTLVDLKSNEVYQYTVENLNYGYTSNNYASYPLSLFKNIKVSQDEYFDDSSYLDGNVDEEFKLTLDFSNIEIEEDIEDIELSLELFDGTKKVVPTQKNTIKKFDIYYDSDSTTYLTSTYEGVGLTYNDNSTTNFSISTGIQYQTLNNAEIIDTRYEDMKLGLEIKLLDSNSKKLDIKYLKNITFTVDNVTYSPDKDGVYRIEISDNKDVTANISIRIVEDNVKLEKGTYTINISNIISYDGRHSNTKYDEINIPLIVRDNVNNVYHKFSVTENESYRIISSTDAYKNLSYSIIKQGWMLNPNIRVSLYKKEYQTAYNQDYVKVDLNDYISTKLEEVENKTYYAVKNPLEYYYGYPSTINSFAITLLPRTLDNTEYKLVFELYNGNDCISTITKYFIVK